MPAEIEGKNEIPIPNLQKIAAELEKDVFPKFCNSFEIVKMCNFKNNLRCLA